MDKMEQKNVILFLQLKGLSKKTIHCRLVTVLEENPGSHSNVTRFCTEAILGLKSEEASMK
jgi:hypothetical protein